MRILHLAQFHTPVIGGEERHVASLSEALAARGHEVEVATLSHPRRPPVVVQDGVTIRSLYGTTQKAGALFREDERRHAPPFPDPGIAMGIARILSDFRPDVVHAHNWILHSYLPLKRKSTAGFIVTLHDYGLACARKTMMLKGKVCPGPSLTRCLPCSIEQYGPVVGPVTCVGNWASSLYERRAVDRFIAVSKAVAERCGLPQGRAPFDVLPTFIPDDVGALGPSDERVASLPSSPYILFVGDLSLNKGVGVLLEAYRRLQARMASVPLLVLIGRRCPDMPHDLPQQTIVFESWPHAAVMHAWSRCLFGVAPSVLPEPCGTVAMEAQAVGRPMIASDTGGLSMLVAHNETGFLVPPGDPDALSAAMETMISDHATRERMAMASPRWAENFMAKSVVPRIEQIYAQVLPNRAGVTSFVRNAPLEVGH